MKEKKGQMRTVVQLSSRQRQGCDYERTEETQRTCHVPGLAAARKRHGDELEG